jgi:hypothetical protein
MNIEHYTPVQLNKRPMHASQFFTTHFEPFLLSLLVLTGIIGTIYLFGQKIVSSDPSSISSPSGSPAPLSVAGFFMSNEEEAPSNDFNEYIKMEGKVEAGKTFHFKFLQDEKASRYVMEMGDGVRLIVTQKELRYEYAQPGKYIIELKEIKNGLLNIVGTKKIKVK